MLFSDNINIVNFKNNAFTVFFYVENVVFVYLCIDIWGGLIMKVKKITRMALCLALTIVLSQVAIPFGVVPFTLQTLAVFVCGIVLKPTQAFLVLVIYILLGIIGLPVFATGASGFGIISGPTGGFIVTFPLMAYYTSYYIEMFEHSKHFKAFMFMVMTLSLVFCYLVGALGITLTFDTDFINVLKVYIIPFVIPDLVKALIASYLILPALYHLRNQI